MEELVEGTATAEAEEEHQNPLDVTPRGKKVQAEGLELLQ